MSIEIKDRNGDINCNLFIDGYEVNEQTTIYDPLSSKYVCEINEEKFAQEIIKFDVEELLIFKRLILNPLMTLDSKISLDLEIHLKEDGTIEDLEDCDIYIYLRPNIHSWNNLFTYAEYEDLFLSEIKQFEEIDNLSIVFQKQVEPAYRKMFLGNREIEFLTTSNLKQKTIDDSISECVNKIKEIDKLVHNKFLQDSIPEQIITKFIFPDQIKNECQQYLLYFTKFLQDLGVSVSSKITEEAGKVLFSVSPTDDNEALDRIREALAIYLNLPASPISDIEYSENFALMRLQHQVRNLHHSQQMAKTEILSTQYALRLAQQNIENQDKIIHHQNSFIDNQNKVIEKITSKSIMIDSLESKEELEKFCEGFEVGKSEFLIKHFGLHLNPATVLKTAGRKILGKEENKSVLGLDKETNQENS